jgi:hypothetical protein
MFYSSHPESLPQFGIIVGGAALKRDPTLMFNPTLFVDPVCESFLENLVI